MTSYGLLAWIQSHGLPASQVEGKSNLLARAENIRKSLLGDQPLHSTTQLPRNTTVSSEDHGKRPKSLAREQKVVIPQWMLKGSWRQQKTEEK